jgi:NAD(P)-dependent dehydrogenase (short-subunit alcohol dehydrogenase family)
MRNKKTYLVSGAGSGIGRAIAIALASASEENQILLLGRNQEALLETRSFLNDPQRHAILLADIRDQEVLSAEFRRIRLETQELAGVIANSGVGGENHYGPKDRWNEIVDTNLSGTYQLINEALPALRGSSWEYKHIVVVSSILSRIGVPQYSAYCASKSALLGLVRSWASEFAQDRILVNAVCPGWVETEMAREGLRQMAQNSGISYDEALARQMAYVPLRKMSQPEEIGALIRFLVSGAQCSMTGQTLDINNGAYMH